MVACRLCGVSHLNHSALMPAGVLLSLGIAACCSQQVTTPGRGAQHERQTAPDVLIEHAPTRALLRQAGIRPELIRCNTDVRWVPNLGRFAKQAAQEILPDDAAGQIKAKDVIIGYLVRAVFQEVQPHNLGVVRLRGLTYQDSHGRTRPLLVFRSGMTFAPQNPCLGSLVRHGGVKHVINLYDGQFPLHDLVEEERQVAISLGASYYDARSSKAPWRPLVKKPAPYKDNLPEAMRRVARLIQEQILTPDGHRPRGNVHLHCGGGMHRTGMIFGILRRCINHDPMIEVETEYNRHTDYKACQAGRRCGHEPLNLQFIRDFDCSLLKVARARP